MNIRETTIEASLPAAGKHSTFFIPKFTEFGIVLPAGVTPINWRDGEIWDTNTPEWKHPLAFDDDIKVWSPWHIHPHLNRSDVMINWTEPDGQVFWGWRLENRDENLDRGLYAKFVWPEVGGADIVVGTILPGGIGAQLVYIGILPSNEGARIEIRPTNGNYGDATPGLTVGKAEGRASLWYLRTTIDFITGGYIARITAPHLAGGIPVAVHLGDIGR